MIKRFIQNSINSYLKSADNKILFVWGPRRSGKTTLIDKLALDLNVTKYNFDLQSDREKFAPRKEILEKIVKENQVILIDEVQNYPESTVILKILYDEFNVKIIATGSSELRQKKSTNFDSLAGRFTEIYCLPLSFSEIYEYKNSKESEKTAMISQLSQEAQIWGMYPEVYTESNSSPKTKIDILQNILDTYILKDVVNIYELKNQKLAKDILLKIALQLGSEVSIREIANSLGSYPSTVSNYIEIFIKNYILIPLPSFKTNLRKAVSENRKLYFYDLGVRNMLVQDFRNLNLRPDKGGIFENFIITELDKIRRLTNAKVNFYFYREYGGKEVDLVVEDYKKNYTIVEIKSQKGKIQKIFPLKSDSKIITNQNYFEILTNLLKNK